MLDNLIAAGAIPPTVAAFLRPVERLVEYADDARHADFLCTELIPTLEAELALPADRSCRFAMGASFGAVASLSAASRHPDVFGGLLLQSGSFAGAGTGCRPRPEPLWRPVRAFVRSYLAAPARVADRVAVTCGVYESLICENRALVPELAGTGMDVQLRRGARRAQLGELARQPRRRPALVAGRVTSPPWPTSAVASGSRSAPTCAGRSATRRCCAGSTWPSTSTATPSASTSTASPSSRSTSASRRATTSSSTG